MLCTDWSKPGCPALIFARSNIAKVAAPMSFNQKKRKLQGFPALNYGHKFLKEGLDLDPLAYRLESLSYTCLISLVCSTCRGAFPPQVSLLHMSLLCCAMHLLLPAPRPGCCPLTGLGHGSAALYRAESVPSMGGDTTASILSLLVQPLGQRDSHSQEGSGAQAL